jgi:hypothetical protein
MEPAGGFVAILGPAAGRAAQTLTVRDGLAVYLFLYHYC